jgi:hypothetical protein
MVAGGKCGSMNTHWISAAVVLVASLAAPSALAEPWVDKMIADREHDFGTVARGSDTVYRFPVKNIFKQDVELVSVRSSCGCTSPTLENRVLKTGDIGYVVARFNTRTFTGLHGATLTLDVKWNDKNIWRRGETQMRVHGNIRGDVVFKPGAIKFDSVDQGHVSEQVVEIAYRGRTDWKIVDVRGDSQDLEVELSRKPRSSDKLAYELLVRLKDTAPAGYFNDQLVLVTNDSQNPRIPIHVSGRVISQISVAPEPLVLGDVKFGEQVSKKFIVRGKKPFRILSIECDEDSFQFNVDREPRERHVVEIVFDAKKEIGNVKQLIRITTDLGEKAGTTLTAYAKVIPDNSQPTATEPGADADQANESTASDASDSAEQIARQ